ncbi:hypothetical protein TPA0910_15620 [Streptomyces hygroscopicus subsp. sporocinereus]|uniref:Uncharacterized protein n=1 Tax=Streptomyces hygroscopicus TaxID=1912 RepID=A0ABQ3TV14_STRHY|nr:hypothetical protein TPA0910_15620 [Streptomyces hygroscopicus]
MALDALGPGPDGSYPWFPRLPDGSPAWSDRCPADYHGGRVPRGMTTVMRNGRCYLIDQTPRDANGAPIDPPVRPE